ncbi:hypothetical protein [Agromyces atrinae]|uniref:Uncharacterized protein n=1 Tax=Agromyces atrinae TaxID=592376 RepID=A0A4Q2M1L7_9MICO|nr:hypothetical protein [Agromyces atrinae]NYD68832.1 hypothetical protein [Agromyces atrinae]RXZ85795.1 hypothetical protein ESP50_13440 [Agromyces atrinae]
MLFSPFAAVLVRAAEEEFNPDDVTPGIWGFVITFLLMVAVLLLVLDMVRRVRRTNYRAEIDERLQAEVAERDAAAAAVAVESTPASSEPLVIEPAATDDASSVETAPPASSAEKPESDARS